jgi:glycosyltransferase involved in cell wall biosynthesis
MALSGTATPVARRGGDGGAGYTGRDLEWAGTADPNPSPAGDVGLSVVIASRDRRELLRRCLEGLRAQTADPASFEVIVADDGSTDGTGEEAERSADGLRVRVLRFDGRGKYRAANAAMRASSGAVCLILDDDVIPSPELVAAHLAAHGEDPRTLGIGAITQQPPPGRDWYARAFARAWNEHYADFDRREADWSDCYGANFSAPRAALLEVGGFATDLPLAGDLELGLRLQRAGCTPRYLPDGHGVHDDGKPSARMLADADRQGAVHVELARRYPDLGDRFLAWRMGAGPVELALRRLAIALRLPPRPLAALGAVIPAEGRRMVWFHFVRRLAFWRSVRGAVDRAGWRRLTGGPARGGRDDAPGCGP